MDDWVPLEQFGRRIPHELLRRLGVEPTLKVAFDDLGRALVGELDMWMLETIALRVATRRECQYIWAAHAVIATTHASSPFSREHVARIATGHAVLTGRDALLVRAVDELLDRGLSGSAAAELASRALRVTLATHFYDTV